MKGGKEGVVEWRGEGYMVESDEWGEGWGMMEGEPAGPLSSMGARRPWAVGRCWPCALAGRPWGVVLSVGVRHAWVVCRHCIWEGRRRVGHPSRPCVRGSSRPWVGALLSLGIVGHGGSRPWVGGLLCRWALSVVGAGWSF